MTEEKAIYRVREDKKGVFLYYWKVLFPGSILPVPEYEFAPGRKWRFDWAFPDRKIAVEVEGGNWGNGRHTRGKGYEDDCEKYNAAVAAGWSLFRFTPGMLEREPFHCARLIKNMLDRKIKE